MYSVTVADHLALCSNNIGTHNERIIDNEFLSASIILLYMYQPKNVYSGTSEKGTLWDQYKFKWFVPFIEVVLF